MSGDGDRARSRLKSASASYGWARSPYAIRLASRTTLRRSGWKASATTAVPSSESQNPLVRPSTSLPTVTTRTV